jgi:anti-sigma B factor antagonist
MTERGGHVLYQLEGTLQAPAAAALGEQVGGLLRGGHRRVLLDLAGLTCIDAAGVGALVGALTMTNAAGGELRISHPRPRVKQFLDVAGVLGVLTGE